MKLKPIKAEVCLYTAGIRSGHSSWGICSFHNLKRWAMEALTDFLLWRNRTWRCRMLIVTCGKRQLNKHALKIMKQCPKGELILPSLCYCLWICWAASLSEPSTSQTLHAATMLLIAQLKTFNFLRVNLNKGPFLLPKAQAEDWICCAVSVMEE